jgi:hypothetical protein
MSGTYLKTDIIYGRLVITNLPKVKIKEKNAVKGAIVYIEDQPFIIGEEVLFCDETQKYENSKNVRYGIINSQGERGTMLFNNFKTVQVISAVKKKEDEELFIMNEDIAYSLGYLPSKSSNYFYHPTKEPAEFLSKLASIRTFAINIRTTHHADDANKAFVDIQKIYEETKYKSTFRSRTIARLLGNLTFGVEFETSQGTLQTSFLGPGGIVPVVDGSLSSRDQYEYATVILKGAKGLESLKKVCKRLMSQCRVDHSCAMHVHIGSLPKRKEFILALYQLFYRLQDELFNLVPFYKRHEQAIMGKQKEYSERLIDLGIGDNSLYKAKSKEEYEKELMRHYNEIFSFITCGAKPDKKNNPKIYKQTKYTPWNRQWDCPTRYYAMNLVNYFFSSGTVEFRLHGPTVNFHKTLMWLLICNTIVRYADVYSKKILEGKDKIKLTDVICQLYDNFGEDAPTKVLDIYKEVTDSIIRYMNIIRDKNKNDNVKAVHRALNGRTSVNSEHVNNAMEEFKNDSTSFTEELY